MQYTQYSFILKIFEVYLLNVISILKISFLIFLYPYIQLFLHFGNEDGV